MADLSITAASVVKGSDAQTELGTAGATIAAGQPVYKDSSDSNKLKLADADTLAASAAVGIALHAAAAGQPLLYQTTGLLTIGATVAPGQVYYVSTTAGGICPFADLSSGDFPTKLGMATTSAIIKVGIESVGAAI